MAVAPGDGSWWFGGVMGVILKPAWPLSDVGVNRASGDVAKTAAHCLSISSEQKSGFHGRDRGAQCWRRCGDAVRSCEWHLSVPPTSSASCTTIVILSWWYKVHEAAGARANVCLAPAEPTPLNPTIRPQLWRHCCTEVRKIIILEPSVSHDLAAVHQMPAVAACSTVRCRCLRVGLSECRHACVFDHMHRDSRVGAMNEESISRQA